MAGRAFLFEYPNRSFFAVSILFLFLASTTLLIPYSMQRGYGYSESNNLVHSSSIHLVKSIRAGYSPRFVAYDPANDMIYAALAGAGSLVAIDPATNNIVGKPTGVGGFPLGVVFDPSNKEIYAISAEDMSASAISSSTNKVVATIGVAGSPVAIIYNPSDKNIYELGSGGAVSVISSISNTVIKTINLGQSFS